MTLVLVVDDEPQIRRALRTSLEAHGYQVATVGTGEEGVVGVAEQGPDLVLLDLGRRLVSRDGEPIHLTPTEYGLLEAFVTNPGKLLTHQWLLRKVWGQGYGTETTYLRTYVRALRKKLGDDAQAPDLIVTEPGVGYRWVAEHTAEAG